MGVVAAVWPRLFQCAEIGALYVGLQAELELLAFVRVTRMGLGLGG